MLMKRLRMSSLPLADASCQQHRWDHPLWSTQYNGLHLYRWVPRVADTDVAIIQ